MRRAHFGVALVLAAVFAALGGGSALACTPTSFSAGSASGGPVGPGDTVAFSIYSKGETSSAYTVSVEGRVVASGTASPGETRGTFTMPDLGDGAREVSAGVV